VQGVKGLVTDFDSRWCAAVREHRLRDLARDVELADLQLEVGELLALRA
jgi:hypothetical protein